MSGMETLTFLTLIVTGFTACAEFGSYAFVHPVIRRLPPEHHVVVEQGLVRTFGRVMPVLMPASLILLVVWASADGFDQPFLQAAVIATWGIGLVTTVLVNVGINLRTVRWDDTAASGESWQAMRTRWELFQAVRSWAFLLSFVLVCLAVARAIS